MNYTQGQPVVIESPLDGGMVDGRYVGVRAPGSPHRQPGYVFLRVLVDETAHGYAAGDVVSVDGSWVSPAVLA